jgi:hypothetical protein
MRTTDHAGEGRPFLYNLFTGSRCAPGAPIETSGRTSINGVTR